MGRLYRSSLFAANNTPSAINKSSPRSSSPLAWFADLLAYLRIPTDGRAYDIFGGLVLAFVLLFVVPTAVSLASESCYAEDEREESSEGSSSSLFSRVVFPYAPLFPSAASQTMGNVASKRRGAAPAARGALALDELLAELDGPSSEADGANALLLNAGGGSGAVNVSALLDGNESPLSPLPSAALLQGRLAELSRRVREAKARVGAAAVAVTATERLVDAALRKKKEKAEVKEEAKSNKKNDDRQVAPATDDSSAEEGEVAMDPAAAEALSAAKAELAEVLETTRASVNTLLASLAKAAKGAKQRIEALRVERDGLYVVKWHRQAASFGDLSREERRLYRGLFPSTTSSAKNSKEGGEEGAEDNENEDEDAVAGLSAFSNGGEGFIITSPRLVDEAAAIAYFIKIGDTSKQILLFDGGRWVPVKSYGSGDVISRMRPNGGSKGAFG